VVATWPSSGGPEVRDDRWGPPVSRHEERAKAAQLEALPCEEGGNRIRRHRCVGRPRGRGPVGRGGAASWTKKGMGHGWAERPDGPKSEENYFRIKFGFLNIQRLWKFEQGDLGGILT
jgi:hypothetical protein